MAQAELFLFPAPDDLPTDGNRYQSELKDFGRAMGSEGLKVGALMNLRKSVGGGSEHLGQFLIDLSPALAPAVGTVVGAWLQARFGRKARLKIGDVEAEARTPQEVEQLVKLAAEYKSQADKG